MAAQHQPCQAQFPTYVPQQQEGAQHLRLLAQYGVSEARLANADEMGSMLEEARQERDHGESDRATGGVGEGIVLQAVVQHVEKADGTS